MKQIIFLNLNLIISKQDFYLQMQEVLKTILSCRSFQSLIWGRGMVAWRGQKYQKYIHLLQHLHNYGDWGGDAPSPLDPRL